ncbi:hypothetical protein ABFS83_05G105800 [Erythranthe nasuta]
MFGCKQVKGHHVTHLQLAEEWILKSCKILELPYSKHAYASAIEEAEQFLWAGSEMDLVREIENNLIQAKNWAKAVKDCFSKVKSWSNSRNCKTERVQIDRINELLNLKTAPCNEPSHLQLKDASCFCLLQNAEELRNINIIGEGSTSCLVPDLERQVLSIEAVMEAGISLGLEFNMTLKLQGACSMLKWCIKALSRFTIPSHEEVEMMLDASSNLPVVFISCALSTALTDGLRNPLKFLIPIVVVNLKSATLRNSLLYLRDCASHFQRLLVVFRMQLRITICG